MNLQWWWHHWSGHHDLLDGLYQTHQKLDAIERKLDLAVTRMSAQNAGVARIIAKLEPDFSVPETSSETLARSDQLGREVMSRLITEHLARQHAEGKQ